MALISFRKSSRALPSPKVDPRERVYAIGDIHGRFDLMIRLLDRIVRDAEAKDDGRKVRLVFIGDYIDRGDASADVLDALSHLAMTPDHNAIFLLGNHEDAMLTFLDAPHQGASWLRMGGQQTLASYGMGHVPDGLLQTDPLGVRDELARAAEDHIPFLNDLKPKFVSGDVVFSHAGLNPARDLTDQSRDALAWGHPDFLQDWPLPGKRVVHGHYDDVSVVTKGGRICVDTGAYYSGVLTAVRLDDSEAFISTAD